MELFRSVYRYVIYSNTVVYMDTEQTFFLWFRDLYTNFERLFVKDEFQT